MGELRTAMTGVKTQAWAEGQRGGLRLQRFEQPSRLAVEASPVLWRAEDVSSEEGFSGDTSNPLERSGSSRFRLWMLVPELFTGWRRSPRQPNVTDERRR